MQATGSMAHHIIVSELDQEKIAALRASGYCVVRIAPNHFGNDSCIIDGFVMVKRG